MASQTLTIRRPDDWHVHLRDGEMLRKVAPYTARQFARAIVMPNLAPPVTSVALAAAYRDLIRAYAHVARPFRWSYSDPSRRILANPIAGTAY